MKPAEIKVHSLDSKPNGSVFFELLPRAYEKECWNADSVYLDEEVFGLVEPVIIESVITYDHYAFTELRSKEIEKVIEGLDRLSASLRADDSTAKAKLGYFFTTTKEEVLSNWSEFRPRILEMSDQLSHWFKQTSNAGQIVTILGI